MKPVNDLVINAFPSQTSSTSAALWANSILRASFQVSISSGSLTGTFNVQASNDQAIGAPAIQFLPTNWNTITSVTVVCSNTTQGAGSFYIQYFETSYEYLRLSYTAGNGGNTNGVYSVRMVSKGL